MLSSQHMSAININNSGSLQHAIENGDIIDASGKRPVGLEINRLGASYRLCHFSRFNFSFIMFKTCFHLWISLQRVETGRAYTHGISIVQK